MSKKEVLLNPSSKEFEQKRQKALKTSINEGAVASVSTGVSNAYIIPFALKLSSQSTPIGFLSSLSGLASPIAQIFGSRLMEKKHRKNIILYAVFFQALLWLPIALIAFFSYKNILSNYLIYIFIALYTLLVFVGGIAGPAWFSWMGDIVPEETRGKYFAKRNLIAGILELAAALIAVSIVSAFENKTYAILGFGILFTLACIFRLFSFELLRIQFIPHLRPMKSYKVKLAEFIKRNKNFKKFTLYLMLFNIALMFASPFFAVYMLQELKFSYLIFIIVSMSSTVFYLVFTPLMGLLSDKYGNKNLIIISSIAFVFSPLCWIFIKNPLTLIIIPQLVAGIANAAYNMGTTNYSYSNLNEKQRGFGVAYLNILVGIGTFIGSILGGLLLDYGHIQFMNKFLFIFALASALRLAVTIFFIPSLKKEKKKAKFPSIISLTHHARVFNSEAKNFIFYLQKKEAQGLKVWTRST